MNKQHLNLEDVLADYKNESDLLEVPLRAEVFRGFRIFAFILTLLVGLQIINLGVIKKDSYSTRAFLNANEVKIESAPRGIILDRYDEPLVRNEPAFDIYLTPKELPKEFDKRIKTIKKISTVLKINPEDLTQRIKKTNWNIGNRLFLTNNLSHDDLVNLLSSPISGIQIEPGFKRVQSTPFVYSHLVGYTGQTDENDLVARGNLGPEDEVGKSGLEAYYDNELRGKNGEKVFIKSALGKIENSKILKTAENGQELKTFIDAKFQEYFYKSLASSLGSLGRTTGVGIAVNPQNGEVLALIGIPGFDSLNIADYLNDQRKPLFNRAISGLYSPGSTIKPLVGLAALSEGVISPGDQIFSAGFIDVPNPYDPNRPSRFLDWKAHGWVDIHTALARSSNIYFYAVGGGIPNTKSPYGLGISKLKNWWKKFNLDQKTGIDLVGEEKGFLPDPEWKENKKNEPWRLGDTYNVSIGQGDLLVTPIELLNYISAIANGGILYQPRIANSKDNLKPIILKDFREEIKNNLNDVRTGMREAVTETFGSGHILNDLPLEVAVKTGTAQIEDNAKINAFVLGYAPFNNPEIAVLVLIENAKEGSLNVLPVVKDIFLWYYNNRLNKNR